MRGLLSTGLSLSLSFFLGNAQAQDVDWRPAAKSKTPLSAKKSAQPVRSQTVRAQKSDPASLSILGRPVALNNGDDNVNRSIIDRQVTPIAYNGSSMTTPSSILARAKGQDPLQIMPVGEPEKMPNPSKVPDTGKKPTIAGSDDCGPDICAGGPVCCPPGKGLLGKKGWFDCCEEKPYCFWMSAEYLLWSIKDSRTPPLVTTSPAGTPRELAGILTTPGTGVIFGGPHQNNSEFSGGRFNMGFWLDDCHSFGIEGSFLFIGQRTNSYFVGSPGIPILARPYIDANTGLENAQLVAFPNVLAGGVAISAQSSLTGGEANLRWRCDSGSTICGICYRTDLLAGFRYLELDEKLGITESLSVSPTGAVPRVLGPAGIIVGDRFRTMNQFYGGQLGYETEYHKGKWFLTSTGKLALGSIHQAIDITGSTTIITPGVTTTSPGGLLAQPTNIGHTTRNRFGVVPELGIKVGYQCTDNLRFWVGYTFLYMNNVVRPGDQIDRTVNVSQIPTIFGPSLLRGAPRPMVNVKDTDFWAQGVNFGMELRF